MRTRSRIHRRPRKNAPDFIDRTTRQEYLLRSAVARNHWLHEIYPRMVTDGRCEGYSIRKISEMTKNPYDVVLKILSETQVDDEEQDDNAEQLKTLKKNKIEIKLNEKNTAHYLLNTTTSNPSWI